MTRLRSGAFVAGATLAIVAVAASFTLATIAPRARAATGGDALVVRVDGGLVRGEPSTRDDSIRVYRGVPFAAPPVGSLRWRPPAPVASWQGVREATRYAQPCPQVERPGQPGSPVLGSEDCLYLNVWTAAAPGDRRPVMVWIHGGGMRRGNAIDPSRDGSALAARGVVMVSIAYRLGALGFFAHPLLSAESEHRSSGAYGLLDPIAALEWVHRNAEAFGGDPSRITIFGQSGGARIVQYLQATPLAAGLFHRAIAHSSGTFADPVHLRDAAEGDESAEKEGERWAKVMLEAAATTAGGDTLAALRSLPAERVVAAVEGLTPRYAVPVDGWVLPDSTYRLFHSGRQNDVPVLVGWNANEAAGMAESSGAPEDAPGYARRIVEEFGDAAPRFAALYPPGDDPRAAFLRGYGAQTFGWSMRSWARAMSTVRSPAFYYYFERVPSAPASGPGARHGAELAYVFGNLDPEKASEVDRARSELMMAYWAAFATTGDPNGAGRPRWAPHNAAGDETMVFGATVESRVGVRSAELAFFDDFYGRLLSGGGGDDGSAVSSGAVQP